MTHAPAARKRPAAAEDDDGDSEADSTTVPPPDGGWGWVVVWASFMIHIVTDGVSYSFSVLLRKLVDYFGAGEGATSLITAILFGVTLCSGPIASAFVNKWGCRAVTIAGALLSGFSLAISFLATNLATLYVTIGLGAGFGFGLIYLPAIVSVTCYFEKYRSLATGIAVAGSGLGTFIFAPFIEYLIFTYGGWRGAVLILAGLAFNTAILGALFRPLEKPTKGKRRAAVAVELKELPSDKSELKLLLNGDLGKDKQDNQLMLPEPTHVQTVVRSAHNIPTAVQDAQAQPGNNTVPRNVKVLSLNLSATPHQILTSGHNHHNNHGHNQHHHQHNSWRHKSDIARLALSQPTLQTTTGSVQHLAGSGVMYRKDIFYRGSLVNIPHYRPVGDASGASRADGAGDVSPTASSASTLRASWVSPFGRFGSFGSRRARSSARLARSSATASASAGWLSSGALNGLQSPSWLRARTQSDARDAAALRGLANYKAQAHATSGSANLAFADGDAALQGPGSPGDHGGADYGALLDLSEVVHVVEEQDGLGHKESTSKLSRHTSAEGLGGLKGSSLDLESPDSDIQLKVCGCIPCSPETKDTLTEMLDMSLFKDVIFILFTISNFLTSVGFYMPYTYLKAYGENVGLEPLEASWLLSVIGIANTVGRLILGYIADKPWVNRLLVYNLSLTIAGVATVLVVVCQDFYSLAVYASVFGFTIGAYVGLTSVILVDLLGLDKLTNAFGLLLLFQGVASLAGPPIGGWLYDVTKSFKPSFWVAGLTMGLSGVMLFVVPPIQRRIEAKRRAACKQVVSSPAASNGNAQPQQV